MDWVLTKAFVWGWGWDSAWPTVEGPYNLTVLTVPWDYKDTLISVEHNETWNIIEDI
jgi:hypothetical protein